MLFLLFHLGKDTYALEATQVREVIPLVDLKKVPLSPRGVAGVFNYHGTPVPVIDLCELMMNHPAQKRLSTRIILIDYANAKGPTHLLGLITEKATETMQREPVDFIAPGFNNPNALYLGPVTTDARGFIQWIKIDQLLPESIRDLLFNDPVEHLF